MELKIIDHPETFFEGSISENNVFLNAEWWRLMGNERRTYGILKGRELLAFFQVVTYRRLGQTIVIHPPFSPHCGFTLVRRSENNYTAQTELKRMLRLMADFFADKSNADYVDIAFPPDIIDMQPFIWAGFRVEPKYSYGISTAWDEDILFRNMSSERKKNLRDAERAGYELSLNNQPDAVHALIDESLKNTAVKSDSDHLSGILNGNDSWRFWTVVSRDGIARAATVIVFDRERSWYVAGGYDHKSGDSLAGTWALWNAILEVKKRGIRHFDFNGSSVQSIEKYFRGFGGELKPRFRVVSKPGMIGILKNLKNQMIKK